MLLLVGRPCVRRVRKRTTGCSAFHRAPATIRSITNKTIHLNGCGWCRFAGAVSFAWTDGGLRHAVRRSVNGIRHLVHHISLLPTSSSRLQVSFSISLSMSTIPSGVSIPADVSEDLRRAPFLQGAVNGDPYPGGYIHRPQSNGRNCRNFRY